MSLISRAVILGSTGFLAGSLVRFFAAARHPCRSISASEIDLRSSGAISQLAGVLTPADTLIFCAALTPEKGRDQMAFNQNIAMMEHVCAALSVSSCAHVIYISSDAVYSDTDNVIDEGSPCAPDAFYGQAHLVREQMLSAVCEPAILRAGAIYGAADTHNSYGPNRFVRSALAAGVIHLFGEGEDRRDHIAIHDVVTLIALCVRHRSTGVLNAVTGDSMSFREIAAVIANSLPGVNIAAAPRQQPLSHRYFDNRALRAAFPEFCPTPPDAGIRAMIAELRP